MRKKAAVPRPGIARLSLTSKIKAKLHRSHEVRKLNQGEIAVGHVHDRARQVKEQLAMQEEAEQLVAGVAI